MLDVNTVGLSAMLSQSILLSFGLTLLVALIVNAVLYLKAPWWPIFRQGPIRLLLYANAIMLASSFLVMNYVLHPSDLGLEENLILNLPVALGFALFTVFHYRNRLETTQQMIPRDISQLANHLGKVLDYQAEFLKRYDADFRLSIVQPLPSGLMILLQSKNIPARYNDFYRLLRWGRLVRGIAGRCATIREPIVFGDINDVDNPYIHDWIDFEEGFEGGIICIPIIRSLNLWRVKYDICLAVLSVSCNKHGFLTSELLDELNPFVFAIKDIILTFSGLAPLKQKNHHVELPVKILYDTYRERQDRLTKLELEVVSEMLSPQTDSGHPDSISLTQTLDDKLKFQKAAMLKTIESQAADTQELLSLDDLLTYILELIEIKELFEDDANGTDGRTALDKQINQKVEQFPSETKLILSEELRLIELLFKNGAYKIAEQRLLTYADLIAEYLSDGREPPEEVKAILDNLPQPDINV